MYHEAAGKLSFWLVFLGTWVTFFPMHIVGLEGMPRRIFTYPSYVGWTALNMLESVGSYLLGAGLLLVVVNLAVSLRRGAPASENPWNGETLEWATSSPPPPYNYAVIPTVSSAYPMWDREDREHDAARLERGEGVLARGHETPASTVQDAELDEVLAMPPHSLLPLLLGIVLALMFIMLLVHHYLIALGIVGVGALGLAAWHGKEPTGE